MAPPDGRDESVAESSIISISVSDGGGTARASMKSVKPNMLEVFKEYYRQKVCHQIQFTLEPALVVDFDADDRHEESLLYPVVSYVWTHFLDTVRLGIAEASVLSCAQARFHRKADVQQEKDATKTAGIKYRCDPDFAQYVFCVKRDGGLERIKTLANWVEIKPKARPQRPGQATPADERLQYDLGFVSDRDQLFEQYEMACAMYPDMEAFIVFYMRKLKFTGLWWDGSGKRSREGVVLSAGTPERTTSESSLPSTNGSDDDREREDSEVVATNVPFAPTPSRSSLDPETFQGTYSWDEELSGLLLSSAEAARQTYRAELEELYGKVTLDDKFATLCADYEAKATAQHIVDSHPRPIYHAAPIFEGRGAMMRTSDPFTNALRLAHSRMAPDVTYEQSDFFKIADNEDAYEPPRDELIQMAAAMELLYDKSLRLEWDLVFERHYRGSMEPTAPDTGNDSGSAYTKDGDTSRSTIDTPPRRAKKRKSKSKPKNSKKPKKPAKKEQFGEIGWDPSSLDNDIGSDVDETPSTGPAGTSDTGNRHVHFGDGSEEEHEHGRDDEREGSEEASEGEEASESEDASGDEEAFQGGGTSEGGSGRGETPSPSSLPTVGTTSQAEESASQIAMPSTTSISNAPDVLTPATAPTTDPPGAAKADRSARSVRASNLLNSVFDFDFNGSPAAFSTPVSAKTKNPSGVGTQALAGAKKKSSDATSVPGPIAGATALTANAGGDELPVAGPSRPRRTTANYARKTQSSRAKERVLAEAVPPDKKGKRKQRSEPDDSEPDEPPDPRRKKAKRGGNDEE